MARYIDAEKLCKSLRDGAFYQNPYKQSTILGVVSSIENFPTADVASKSEVAREIFEEIKRSKVTLGHPAKIICFRATPTGEVEETVEGWVVPQSRIEELEKKYIGGKTDEDISD